MNLLKHARLLRFIRRLTILLGAWKPSETKFYLFNLPKEFTAEQLKERLWQHGWGENTLSTPFKGQILTLRKPVPPSFQMHLRFIECPKDKTIMVEGHYEVDPFIFLIEHAEERTLRKMNNVETRALKDAFKEV